MNRQKTWRAAVICLAVGMLSALLLNGCMVGPNFHSPGANVPPAWVGVPQTPTGQPSMTTSQPAELTHWWQKFNDPQLTALVEQALNANLDLQLAVARLRQARAARGVVAGGLWPAVNGSATYQRTNSTSATGIAAVADGHNLFQAGLDAMWELDIFGGVRRNVESANANIQAAQEGVRDASVTLVAEVALNYVQLRGFQQQIVIAQNNLKAQQHTAEITRQHFVVGFVSGLDVANATALVATTASQIPVLETSAQQAIYTLSVLLARPPAALLQELSATQPLPIIPPAVPVGLPSDLLRRRPDIQQAEAQMHAAAAQIGVATADLFPKFSLTGSLTYQSNLLQNLFAGAKHLWSFGPAVSWSIFQGGSIQSNIRVQEALRDQAFITYQKTVLTALQDVENALIAFDKEWQHYKALNEAVVANRKAVDLSLQLYTQGQTDFLSVLVAQLSLYTSENALVQSTQNTATDLIAIYKALGGGWEDEPSGSVALCCG
jgi:outer membrane protein, multidrug efflux system